MNKFGRFVMLSVFKLQNSFSPRWPTLNAHNKVTHKSSFILLWVYYFATVLWNTRVWWPNYFYDRNYFDDLNSKLFWWPYYLDDLNYFDDLNFHIDTYIHTVFTSLKTVLKKLLSFVFIQLKWFQRVNAIDNENCTLSQSQGQVLISMVTYFTANIYTLKIVL